MLISKKPVAQRRKKIDWFPVKPYAHFDSPLSREAAAALVESPDKVATHRFYPFITFNKIERRYRRRKEKLIAEPKLRKLAYCSNHDACVFGYYAHLLNQRYETALATYGLDAVVVGYRKNISNIKTALVAFNEVKNYNHCVAFAFDIKGFFDNISHEVLKKNWCDLLSTDQLPQDHYNVFRNLTRFSSVDRRALLKRLGHDPSALDRDLPGPPLCSAEVFRQVIRGNDGLHTNLVVRSKQMKGIPQGSPISAVAANISMLAFDIALTAATETLGGSYRRYSDDLLVIVPHTQQGAVKSLVLDLLRKYAGQLRINGDKTSEVMFDLSKPPEIAFKPLQYLGFLFDGERILIRPNTISRYWRRVHREVRRTMRLHGNAQNGLMKVRKTIHMRRLLSKTTHLGGSNLITGYAKTARDITGSKAITKQFRHHHQKIEKMIKDR